MVTVLNSVGNKLRVFSNVRLTSARPLALRVLDPLKTRLSRFSLLNWLIFCSPITQRILSTILLLPQPLGPITPVIPSSKFRIVLSAKLLKPFISRLFNLTVSKFIFIGLPERTCGHAGKYISSVFKKFYLMSIVFYTYTQLFHSIKFFLYNWWYLTADF